MLGLKTPTNDEWIAVAAQNLDQILIDHAHCEKKAAANGMAMISRYPDREMLVRAMIELIKEETEHFEFIYEEIRRRDLTLTRDRGDRYVQELSKHINKNEPLRMLDFLLTAALIEARSCERFSLLSKCNDVPADLRKLYHDLMASEAGHYRAFTDIAREFFPKEQVKARLEELLDIEAEIVRGLPNEATMHG